MHTWILLGLLRFNYTLYETNLEVAKWKLNIWPINRLLQQHRKEGRMLESFLKVLWDMSSQDGFMEVQLDGRESGWTPGVGDGQGGLACCDAWGRKESDTTERLHLHAYVSALPVCLQATVSSLGTGTMSYSSLCLQDLVQCLAHSRCSINVVKTNQTANKIQIKIQRPSLCSIPSLVQMLKTFFFNRNWKNL